MTNQLLNNRYQIIRTLGAGGFGETFLAEDTHMPSRRRCVVKRLRPVQDNPQINQLVQERFQREAAILEKLGNGHRQIPELYAYFYGQTDQQFYLVQEWIDGDTLSTLVQQGRLTEAEVRRLLVAILPVFDFIHRQSIIHRDVKPDNIIVRRSDGQPVLIDFGAVRETMGTTINSQGHPTRSIVIGTPGYMASEQSVGRPVYSSDLYSLGLTAIYLLTGQHPDEFTTNPQTSEILWRSPQAQVNRSVPPQVSPELAHILDQAISSHPRDRYQTAIEFLGALQGQQPVTVPTIWPDTRTKTLVVSPAVVPTVPATVPITTPLPPEKSSWPRSRFLVLGGVIAGITGSAVLANLLQPAPSPQTISPSVTSRSVETDTPAQPESTTPPLVNATVSPSSSAVPNVRAEQSPIARRTDSNTNIPTNSSTSTIIPTCSYFTGKAIEGQPVNVDLCSISNISNSDKVNFTYALGNQRFASTANCNQDNWITIFDQQVHRPLSPATQKMLDRVCQGNSSNSSGMSRPQPTNSPSSAPIQTTPPSLSAANPASSITGYYQDINNRNYQQAWQQLPMTLQSNTTIHPQGYDSFVQWWDSVAAVELGAIETTQQTAQQAQVLVAATYRMKNNRSQPFNLRYILEWNEANQIWSIKQIKRR